MELSLQKGEWNMASLIHYMLPTCLAGISVGCITWAIILYFQTTQTTESIDVVIGEATSPGVTKVNATLSVDIGGGVKHPGVYKIPVGSRMDDAINAAGGLSTEASVDLLERSINRAQRIQDGVKIYIPKIPSLDASHNLEKPQQEEGITSHNKVKEETGSALTNINQASQEELELLQGVGPATALKIIEGRPYTNIEEIFTKKAVGQKIFEKIKAKLTL